LLHKSFSHTANDIEDVDESDQRERMVSRKQAEYEAMLGSDLDSEESEEKTPMDRWGRSPLHECVIQDDLEACKKLISEGADVKARDNNGHSPVQLAFLEERVSFIAFFRSINAI